jgi:phosphoribosyl 1,2-cyclic phosphate phosphodiesterase
MDDLRALTWENPIPVYANEDTITEMRERFLYVFKETQRGGGKPRILPQVIDGPVVIGNLRFTPIPVKHGVLNILGWRIAEGRYAEGRYAEGRYAEGRYAEGPERTAVYLTDTSFIPESSWPLMTGADTVIIGAIRVKPHETHFTFAQALSAATAVKPRRVYITHISHEHSHREIKAICRHFRETTGVEGITMRPARDGLTLDLA